ncbi:heterokaryon incompatibility protein-domain-containing protein [Usnea florida]
MRLLHTTTFRFEDFFDSNVPKYAILSHRWGNGEVTFQDFEIGKAETRPGFVKIKNCCSLAQSRGFEWVWIDTCCIDKKSSAELSEAINSMFRWYTEAEECYAYLADVPGTDKENRVDFPASFKQSQWFTRGWTLQELLAPSSVVFYDARWDRIGCKEELLGEISEATGIGVQYLNEMREASVATKMSWISKRQTSRSEDMAYCLLGLFDVNMPLLYGEGRKAFVRLEREIIKKSNDDSIFAWTSADAETITSGLLALWPDSFTNSADVRSPDSNSSNDYVTDFRVWEKASWGPGNLMTNPSYRNLPQIPQIKYIQGRPYAMTNKGLEFSAHVMESQWWIFGYHLALAKARQFVAEGRLSRADIGRGGGDDPAAFEPG